MEELLKVVVGVGVVVVVEVVVVVVFVVVVGFGVVVVDEATVVVVVRSVLVVVGFSVTGSNVEVMMLLSSETSVLLAIDSSFVCVSEEMRSSTSRGIWVDRSGCDVETIRSNDDSVLSIGILLNSTILSGTVLSAIARSSVLETIATVSSLVGFHR